MNKPQSRIITIRMPANLENYQAFAAIHASHFKHDWEISSTLDPLPQPGETWKNALGEIYNLVRYDGAISYPLRGYDSSSTWTENGLYDASDNERDLNVRNLVERCSPPLYIHSGEWWEDRSGNIHKIKIICPSEKYPIKSTLDYTWTMSGQYDAQISEGGLDLIRKVQVVYCGTVPL